MSRTPVSPKQALSRRGFLGYAAAAGASTLVAPSASRAAGASDTIGVGFIGVGGRGHHLLSETLRLAEAGAKVKPVAVCDIYQVRLEAARTKAKLPAAAAHTDFRKLLEQPDVNAVVIATPDHWHAAMALEAIKAGKDVYVEKPFTQTYQQARQVTEEAEKENKIVQVGVNSCSDTRWLDAFKLIDEGKIGKILLTTGHHSRNSKAGEWNYTIDKQADPKKNLDWNAFLGPARKTSWDPERYFRWRKFWDYSGGIATDLFFHQLTHLLLALDGPDPEFPRRVGSFGGIYQFYDREVPDTFMTTVDYPSNHSVVLIASMANDVGIPEAIRGHEGTIFFEGDELILRYQKEIVGEKEEVRIKSRRSGGAYEHLENFFACVADRKEPACPPLLAYKVQVAINMAVISYREGNTTYWHRRREQIYMCGEALEE
jgi:predicted dehydrogenase